MNIIYLQLIGSHARVHGAQKFEFYFEKINKDGLFLYTQNFL